MKKILTFAALLVFSAYAYAQTGTGRLKIVNNLTCNITITMYATEGTYDGTVCDMESNVITAAPGTTTYAGATVFNSSIGWFYLANPHTWQLLDNSMLRC